MVNELLAEVVARVEPCPERSGLSGRNFPVLQHGIPGGLQTIVRYSKDRGDHMLLVLIKDADNVPVREGIHEGQNIFARLKRYGMVGRTARRQLDWVVHRDVGFF